ncbi:MAG: hypothetical protein AABY22_34130 [Nanoarchaeota archaeon]
MAKLKSLICYYFGNECELAVRIARAESGLREDAIGDHGGSLGLFQVNFVHWHKVNCNLLEAECNLKLAKVIRDESGWYAWSVWKNGTY